MGTLRICRQKRKMKCIFLFLLIHVYIIMINSDKVFAALLSDAEVSGSENSVLEDASFGVPDTISPDAENADDFLGDAIPAPQPFMEQYQADSARSQDDSEILRFALAAVFSLWASRTITQRRSR